MQTSKYLVANDHDLAWGLTVSTVGYDEILPGEEYPTHGHADGYYFNPKKGRTLSEYQLLYIEQGEGEFHSATVAAAPLRAGDLFLVFPGEWHSYQPKATTGWKSYWIGFRGPNMDQRVQAGFLSREKPIYHAGYSAEVIRLYRDALAAAPPAAARSSALSMTVTSPWMNSHASRTPSSRRADMSIGTSSHSIRRSSRA